ncbi:glycosyltransferase family 39 protein [Candidatus Dojkabacteria bacterium]|nr:glycosyltransferase family 39 protein [Candidatus Dojkabacteria bacterium]
MKKDQQKRSDIFRKVIFTALPILLGLTFFVVGYTSIDYKSYTRDENRHLVRGVMLLKTGDYRLNKHHPILGNVITAIPQLFNSEIKIPSTDLDEWKRADKDKLAGIIVDLNGKKRDFTINVLNWSRMATLAVMAICGVIIYFLVKKEWGIIPAIVTSILYFFSPNLLANSRLVTTDAMIVPPVFFATFFLYKYAKNHDRKDFILFTITSFVSLIIKYSAVPIAFLWVLVLFVYEFATIKKNQKSSFKAIIRSLGKPAIVVAVWFVMLFAAYGFRFDTLASTNHENWQKINQNLWDIEFHTQNLPFLTEKAKNGYVHTKFPFPEYIIGFIENVVSHDAFGHDSFLFGQYEHKGWWYYFPAAMLVKMPVPALIGILALFATAGYSTYKYIAMRIKQLKSKKKTKRTFKIEPYWILICVPVFFFLLSMKSSINLGIRHVLVVFPFIYLGIALLVNWAVKKSKYYAIPIVLLGLWYVLSATFIYPHYLEYFNELVGGPKNGYKYLLDSNLSWAQDDLYVEDYVNDLPEGTVVHINPIDEVDSGLVIMDVDRLMGRDRNKRTRTEWIREPFFDGTLKPIDRICYTYMVFDLDEKED